MDNVTHSLFGYALGRVGADRFGGSEPECRAMVWSSVAASNVPDLDVVVNLVAADPKLAYLVHHRGHTHTLLLAFPLGVVVALLCARIAGVGGPGRRRVLALGGLAGMFHIAFDALNNYGVHPFFPLDNGWYYGDAVFIVEPLLLAVMLPLLALRGRGRTARAIGGGLSVMLLALLWGQWPLPLPWAVKLPVTLLLATAFAVQSRSAGRAEPGLLGVASVIGLFVVLSVRADAQVRAHLARSAGDERVLDVVTSPFPGSPLCWSAIAVTHDDQKRYRARFGYLSLAPGLVGTSDCMMPRDEVTAPLQPARLPATGGLLWTGRFEAAVGELRQLSQQHCDARAMLGFVRAAFWRSDSSGVVFGDLRYDFEPGLGFAERRLDGRCSDWLPSWDPPLGELLR